MLYLLGQYGDQVSVLNVFRYITFRTAGATMTAIVFVFLFGPTIIAALRVRQGKGQPIREDGPQNHLLTKKGTPTMGGLMILSGLVVTTLLWANLASPYVWVVLFVTIGFGAVGLYDDYLKVSQGSSNNGFSGRLRLSIGAPRERGKGQPDASRTVMRHSDSFLDIAFNIAKGRRLARRMSRGGARPHGFGQPSTLVVPADPPSGAQATLSNAVHRRGDSRPR